MKSEITLEMIRELQKNAAPDNHKKRDKLIKKIIKKMNKSIIKAAKKNLKKDSYIIVKHKCKICNVDCYEDILEEVIYYFTYKGFGVKCKDITYFNKYIDEFEEYGARIIVEWKECDKNVKN